MTQMIDDSLSSILFEAIERDWPSKLAGVLGSRHQYPIEELNGALIFAAKSGRAECVKLLIPVSDPMVGFRSAPPRGHSWLR